VNDRDMTFYDQRCYFLPNNERFFNLAFFITLFILCPSALFCRDLRFYLWS